MSGQKVPKGYKQTEVGVIPEDWEIAPLEFFTSFISYGFTNPMPTSESGIYMITARDIDHGKIQFNTARCTTVDAYNKLLTAKSKPKKGDLLLTKDGTLGRLALVDDRGICINQSVAVLRPNGKSTPEFLKTLLEAPAYQEKMLEDAGGSTIKHIYITIVNRMLVALPPTIGEQKLIARALSDIDALIEGLEGTIGKKRHIKQGAMQELLTGKRRLPGFNEGKGYKQTEVGVIPEDWNVEPFQNIAMLERGKFTARPRNDPKYYGGDIPFIQTGDVAKSSGEINTFSQTLNQEGIKVSKLFPAGTLFFTIAANIGDVGFAAFDTACPDSLVAIKSNQNINKYWLFHDLNNKKQLFENLATNNTQLNINLEKLRPCPFAVPPLAEQQAIATILSDMDTEIATLEAKLTKTRQLKQGMMHELLTGRIRLVQEAQS
jgi:type I restriction enzyme, S subunit